MPQKKVRLIAGLGNPGRTYKNTRHNAGFMVLDEIAAACSISFDNNKFDVLYGRGMMEGIEVILAKPQSFMNRSGPPVRNLASYFKILCEDMLIVHDDIDLTIGRIKIKEKGGHGGHKGIKSLIDAFGNGEFARLRIGVGRSEKSSVTDHVLGRFSKDENLNLDRVISRSRDAVVSFFVEGRAECMNEFNQKMNANI